MKTFKEFIKEDIIKHLGVHDPLFDFHGEDEKSSHNDGLELHKRPDRFFTHDEHRAVHNYSQSSFRDINHILRNTTSWKKERNEIGYKPERTNRDLKDFKQDYIPHIDKTIAYHTTDHHATVWRGLNQDTMKALNLKKNKIIKDKGFTSTSMRPYSARKFARVDGHLAKIHLPAGSKAVYLNQANLSSNADEHEVLLPRNSKFKYEGSSEHNQHISGTKYHKVTVHHFTHIPE